MNMNIGMRDDIIFGGYEHYAYTNGCRDFDSLTADKLMCIVTRCNIQRNMKC